MSWLENIGLLRTSLPPAPPLHLLFPHHPALCLVLLLLSLYLFLLPLWLLLLHLPLLLLFHGLLTLPLTTLRPSCLQHAAAGDGSSGAVGVAGSWYCPSIPFCFWNIKVDSWTSCWPLNSLHWQQWWIENFFFCCLPEWTEQLLFIVVDSIHLRVNLIIKVIKKRNLNEKKNVNEHWLSAFYSYIFLWWKICLREKNVCQKPQPVTWCLQLLLLFTGKLKDKKIFLSSFYPFKMKWRVH